MYGKNSDAAGFTAEMIESRKCERLARRVAFIQGTGSLHRGSLKIKTVEGVTHVKRYSRDTNSWSEWVPCEGIAPLAALLAYNGEYSAFRALLDA